MKVDMSREMICGMKVLCGMIVDECEVKVGLGLDMKVSMVQMNHNMVTIN